jgi:hypothetical protein
MKALLIATTLMFGSAAMAQGVAGPQSTPDAIGQSPSGAGSVNGGLSTPRLGGAVVGGGSTDEGGNGGVSRSGGNGGISAAAKSVRDNTGGVNSSGTDGYPRCSRMVTDKCIGGGSRRRSGR